MLADLGAAHALRHRHAALAAEQVGFVAGDCDARIAVLDGADQLAGGADQLPGLAKIIVLDPAACPAGDEYLTWADFAALQGWPPRRTRSRPGSPPSARTTR